VVGTVLAWATLESTGSLWRNQREQTLSNGPSGPRSRHHHSLFACADEEVLYRECFFIGLIASLGPFQPRNLIFLSSRALVAYHFWRSHAPKP
jgi:hypothetical protein